MKTMTNVSDMQNNNNKDSIFLFTCKNTKKLVNFFKVIIITLR